MKRSQILGAVLLTAGALRGAPGAAQVSAEANAGFFSAYVWRGVTYTNNLVIQPDASLTLPIRRASLTAGLWANIEPARYDGFSDISESGGTKRFDVAEVNWTGELSVPMTERATLALGATGYLFPNDDGITDVANTVELYGRVELTAPLSPTASLYYDVGPVNGAYVEGGISHAFAAGDRMSLTLGALAGLSAGQHADFDAEGEPRAISFNFNKNGFTHADLWVTADITAGSLAVSPTVHVIVTGDEATKSSAFEHEPGTGLPRLNRTPAKVWFGVTIGWTR